jgi:hypothetical protein
MATRKPVPTAVALVPMTLAKETKNTYRYDADDQVNAPVQAVYIRKFAFDGEVPDVITLTVVTE